MELDDQIRFTIALEEAAGELIGVVEAVRASNRCGLVAANVPEVLQRWTDSLTMLVESTPWGIR